MKRMVILIACVAMLGGAVLAQNGSGAEKNKPGSGGSTLPAVKTVTGVVKFHGDELTLIDDADGKPWNIINPDVVRNYDGQHVTVSGHAFAEKHMIHAHTVDVVKGTSAKK